MLVSGPEGARMTTKGRHLQVMINPDDFAVSWWEWVSGSWFCAALGKT